MLSTSVIAYCVLCLAGGITGTEASASLLPMINVDQIVGFNQNYQSVLAVAKVQAGISHLFSNAPIGSLYALTKGNQSQVYSMDEEQLNELGNDMFSSPTLLQNINQAMSDWQDQISQTLNQIYSSWDEESKLQLKLKPLQSNIRLGARWNVDTLNQILTYYIQYINATKEATSQMARGFISNIISEIYSETSEIQDIRVDAQYIRFGQQYGDYYYDFGCNKKQNMSDLIYGSPSLMSGAVNITLTTWMGISRQLDTFFTV